MKIFHTLRVQRLTRAWRTLAGAENQPPQEDRWPRLSLRPGGFLAPDRRKARTQFHLRRLCRELPHAGLDLNGRTLHASAKSQMARDHPPPPPHPLPHPLRVAPATVHAAPQDAQGKGIICMHTGSTTLQTSLNLCTTLQNPKRKTAKIPPTRRPGARDPRPQGYIFARGSLVRRGGGTREDTKPRRRKYPSASHHPGAGDILARQS
jgi:hypothetical protein